MSIPGTVPANETSSQRTLALAETALWIALLGGTPLFFFPPAYESYQLPKIPWAQTLMVALISLRMLRTVAGQPFHLPLNPLAAILPLYALLHSASVLWAQSPSLASDRAMMWGLVALVSIILPTALLEKPRRLNVLGAALLASAAVTATWALSEDVVQAFFPELVRGVNRLGDWRGWLRAGFGNTSHIGDFLALLYPLGFLVCLASRRRWLFVLMLGWMWLCYAALIAVFSVHSTVGLILGMLVMLAGWWRSGLRQENKNWLMRMACLTAGWLAIALFFTFDVPGNPHRPGIFRQAFASERLAFGWDSRVYIWLTGLEMVRQHTWLGVGAGNFVYAFAPSHSPLVLAAPNLAPMAGGWTNAAHNELIQAWAELGIAGPALLVILVVLAFRSLGRNLSRAEPAARVARLSAMGALAAYVIHAQMNFPLQLPASMLMLALIVSIAVALGHEEEGEQIPVRLEHGWGTLILHLHGAMKPRALSVTLKPRLTLMAVVLMAGTIAIAAQGKAAFERLRSDSLYRQAHDMHAAWQALVVQQGPGEQADQAARQVDERFQRALHLWPDHHDARSEYGEFLVRLGRGRDALDQTQQTMRRLQAWEVCLRRARAWWQLDQKDNARKWVARALAMKPVESLMRPRLAAWAAGKLDEAPVPPDVAKTTEMWGVE